MCASKSWILIPYSRYISRYVSTYKRSTYKLIHYLLTKDIPTVSGFRNTKIRKTDGNVKEYKKRDRSALDMWNADNSRKKVRSIRENK